MTDGDDGWIEHTPGRLPDLRLTDWIEAIMMNGDPVVAQAGDFDWEPGNDAVVRYRVIAGPQHRSV